MVPYRPLSNLKKNIMVLNNVTKFHKILIKTIRLRERTSFKAVNFHKQFKSHNYRKHGAIWTIIELEENIMLLNNVTKFHKILIKNIRVREHTSFKMVNFHKQRAITTESVVTKFHKILIKTIRLRKRTSFKAVNFHKQRAITTESMARYGPLLYDWRESCLLIGPICLHKSLCLPGNWSEPVHKLILHENQLELVSRS